MGIDDKDILLRLQAGEEDAYIAILNAYEAAIYRFFLFSHGNRDLAEDQTSDTFVGLVKSVSRLKADGLNLRAYIYGIARNIKRQQRRVQGTAQLPEDISETLVSMLPNPRETAEHRREVQRVVEGLMSLAEPGRQVMVLRYVEDMSLEEVAEALEMPLNTVKSHIHRNVKMLRAKLGTNDRVVKEARL